MRADRIRVGLLRTVTFYRQNRSYPTDVPLFYKMNFDLEGMRDSKNCYEI